MNKIAKMYVGATVAVLGVLAGVSAAGAGEGADAIETSVGTLEAELLLVVPVVLASAVIFLAVRKGWRWVKGYVG